MRKKIIGTSLCVAMMVGLLAGCGAKKEEKTDSDSSEKVTEEGKEQEEEKEPLKLSIFYNEGGTEPIADDWIVFDLLKEKANVEFDIQVVPTSDYATKRQIILNSGNIPDILAHAFPTATEAFSGLLLPISDYFDKMPNFQKYIADNNLQEYIESMKLSDGNIYYMPVRAYTSPVDDHGWIIRKDLLDKNGLEMPKTMDDLYNVCKKLKELYPDASPIGNRFGSANIMSGFCWGYNTIAGWSYGDGMLYDETSDSWIFAPTTQNWKDMITEVHKFYAEGLLDQEYTTRESDNMEQAINSGKILCAFDWVTNCDRMNQAGRVNDPDFNMVPMVPVTGYEGAYTAGAKGICDLGWSFPASIADEDYFDRFIEFLDWCYTDEAATLLTFGKEGVSYETDADGVHVWKDPSLNQCAAFGIYNNELTLRMDMDAVYHNVSDALSEYRQKCSELGTIRKPLKASPLNADQVEELAVVTTTLKDYTTAMLESFINGNESLDKWDEFVKQCETKGVDQLVDTYAEAWDAIK